VKNNPEHKKKKTGERPVTRNRRKAGETGETGEKQRDAQK